MYTSTSIVEVWKKDLVSEFDRIIKLSKSYNYICLDTEFPGVVSKPIGNFSHIMEQTYQQLRCNCNFLKIIQLGLTLSDINGNLPTPSTWQFNFNFDLEAEMFAEDSLCLLLNANLNFKEHKENGIDVEEFGEIIMSSGLLMNPNLVWITFHGAFDFGYLIRTISSELLPEKLEDFLKLCSTFFVKFYDLKYLLSASYYVKKGLQEIADTLELTGIGPAHQAGSDSFITTMVFFKLKTNDFVVNIDGNHSNKLYGICRSLKQGVTVDN